MAPDVVPGAGIGGGGEGQAGHGGEALRQLAQLQVVGSEVVAPLRQAVGLIDGEQGQGQPGQQPQAIAAEQPLRGDVKQLERALRQGGPGGGGLLGRERGVQGSRGHALLPQALHLVVHQGDQGGDHHGEPLQAEGRHLPAERLAATGGHQHQGRTARQHMLHHRLLGPPEGRITEDLL